MKLVCQFVEHVETFLAAHAVASGNDDGRTFQVVFSLLHMAVDDLHHVFRFRYILGHIVHNHFSFIIRIEHFRLHHAAAHRSHLRTVLRIHNRSHDVTAERRTNLIKQVLILLSGFLILMGTDFQ